MKKYLIYTLIATAAVNTACRFEDDDYFDESASLRIEHFNEKVAETLTGAEHGWVMQYFLGTDVAQYEGFNLYCDFKNNGSVLMAGDHGYLRGGNANNYTEYQSLYELLLEDGPVLAFNSWNDVLTVFSDPVDPSTLAQNGEGMGGDYNFVIQSCDDNKIDLVGQRHRGHCMLVRCDRPWQEHINAVKALRGSISNTTIKEYYVTAGGPDTLYIKNLSTGKLVLNDRLIDPLTAETWSLVFTTDGFHIENEHELLGSKVQDFTLNADKTALVSEDGKVSVQARWDNYIATRADVWAFDLETLTDEQKALVGDIEAALKVYNNAYSLASIGLGKSSGAKAVNGLVVTFYTNAAKSKSNSCGVAVNSERVQFGQIAMTFTEDSGEDQNMGNMSKKSANLRVATRAFANTLNGLYTVTPNDYFLPTAATYASADGKGFAVAK